MLEFLVALIGVLGFAGLLVWLDRKYPPRDSDV